MEGDRAASRVGHHVEDGAADEIIGVQGAAVADLDAATRPEGFGEVPAGPVLALLAEEEDIVFWKGELSSDGGGHWEVRDWVASTPDGAF